MYAITYGDPNINAGCNTQVVFAREYKNVRRIRRILNKLGIPCETQYVQ